MRQETRPKDYDGYVNVEIFKKECFLNDKKKFDVRQYKDAVKQSMHKQISELIEKGYNYKDITILVRNNSDGTEIAEFMTRNEKKIPVISSDSILITSSDKVMLMITALRYIADENNMVAKLSLAYYMDACKTPDADKRELGKAVDNIDNINLDRIKDNTMSLYDVCSQIAKSYDLNIADDIFLQYFMNVVIEWQNSEHGNINDFVEYWDKRSNSFSVMITSDVDAVQIMTIHKSKGLEFKVVMYPYAYTYLPDKVRQSEKWLSYKTDFPDVGDVPHMDNFILPINKSLLNTIFESHYIEEKESASFDDLNIMYVAMTRPKDLLFVYTNDETSSEHDYNLFVDYMNSENNQCTMMSGQLEEDKSYVYVLGEICRNYIKEDKDTGNDILEFTDKNHGETINWTDVLKVDQDTVVITADDKEYNSQEWGILVHEILSKINTKDDARRVMTPYLFSGVIDKKQSEFLLKQFEKIISIEKIKDAYSERCIVKNEMEILTKECEILRPDRYVELPDKIMVIDYKTGKHDDKYYKKQQDYIIALQDMGVKKNIEGYLLYIGDEVCVKPVYIDRLF